MPQIRVTVEYDVTDEQADEYQNQMDTYGDEGAAEWLAENVTASWTQCSLADPV